ncbi:hypothetical protein LTR50_001019 [Elasticomyces elasticus]|nr:hypothetical protein LTR50_001019 [Elasticomyces elasticus]
MATTSTHAMATGTNPSSNSSSSSSSSKTLALATPVSATYPSELRSPVVGLAGNSIKQEEGLKTPITPPLAYLDFLKSMSPALMSPAATSTSSRFSFGEKGPDKACATPSERADPSTSLPPPPPLSRKTSSDSATSTDSSSTSTTAASGCSFTGAAPDGKRPDSPRISIPASSSFAKPLSSRTPRRLHIPQSPFSPANLRSPMSAQTAASPYSGTPLSAAPWSATYSPVDWEKDAKGSGGKVSVRQVVTRTVTYCRTPLDPAPKGKRRKVEEST